jgi:murein L,D-transpeptidase YafK
MDRRGYLGWLIAVSFAGWPPVAAMADTTIALLVAKGERKLYVLRDGTPIKDYWVALGPHPVGAKERQGDGRTPEGRYVIDEKTRKTVFHGWLGLSYPNAEDRARAAALGVAPGGRIAIHGIPEGWGPTGPGVPMIDWTNGCVAMTNHDLDELWPLVREGTTVDIQP